MIITKKALSIVCIITLLITVGLTGCKNTTADNGSAAPETVAAAGQSEAVSQQETAFQPVTATVTDIDQYGSIRLDISAIDLTYGDCVDVTFSGGFEQKDIPYYPDFYGNMNSVILTDHFDTISVAAVGSSLNKVAGIQIGETVAISLVERGKYVKEYEAYDINNGISRLDGQTDEEYRNAREITAGQIQPDRLYRSPSPFDVKYGRVELMGEYLKEHQVNFVLDLADREEDMSSYKDLPEYTASLISGGKVLPNRIGVDYLEEESMKKVAEGLTTMIQSDSPYLIQCSLGRDRTGVICAVIEALCGASYQEIVDDYMLTYDLIHKIDMDPSSLQYRLFKQRIDEQLEALLGIGIDRLPESDLQAPAREYLSRCGMKYESIDLLIEKLTAA